MRQHAEGLFVCVLFGANHFQDTIRTTLFQEVHDKQALKHIKKFQSQLAPVGASPNKVTTQKIDQEEKENRRNPLGMYVTC